jgi:hypothetical protein
LWVRFVAKKVSGRGKKPGRVGGDLSTAQARSDRYRRDFEGLLSEVEGEPLLDREQKLVVLYSNVNEILPILLGLCVQIVDEAVTQLDVGPSLAGPAEQIRAAIRDLIDTNRAAETAGDLHDDASPADRLLEQYQSDLAHFLRRLKRDRRLDREQKFIVLRFNIDRILSILARLCVQAADEPVDASDVGPSLIGATKQMFAVVKDLMQLDRDFMVRRRRAGRRQRPH